MFTTLAGHAIRRYGPAVGSYVASRAANYITGRKRKRNGDYVVPSSARRGKVVQPRYRPPTSTRSTQTRRTVRAKRTVPPRAGRRYVTRGYAGRLKKWRKPSKDSRFQKLGSEKRIEQGGTISSMQCGFIGHHTCPAREVVESLARAVVRHLAKRSGNDFPSWETGHGFTQDTVYLEFYWTTITAGSDAANLDSSSLTVDYTWDQEARLLAARWWAITEGSAPFVLTQVTLKRKNGAQYFPLASINPRQATLVLETLAVLAVQNRTLASTSSDPSNDGNVANNPLIGREYLTTGNGFWPDADKQQIFSIFLYADPQYGLIRDTTGTAGVQGVLGINTATSVNLDQQTLVRPPAGNFFKATSTRSVRLNPGEIKKSVIKYGKSIALSELFCLMYDQMKYQGTPPGVGSRKFYHVFGKTSMFALEKNLDSHESAAPSVSLAYENNLFIRSYLTFKTGAPPAIIEAPLDPLPS